MIKDYSFPCLSLICTFTFLRSLQKCVCNACCIRPLKTRRKPNGAPASIRGRNMLKRYPFEGSGCDFPESLIQRVCTNLKVPILAGAPPPGYPGNKPDDATEDEFKSWEKSARVFVEFYSLLFLPFSEDIDPRDPMLPHLPVLPWNVDTSLDKFTTIFRS